MFMFNPSLSMPPKSGPQTVTGKKKLENIQSRAARFVTRRFQRTESITDILTSLNWHSLENRRNITDIITCHKILHRKLEVPTQDIFIPHTSYTRSNIQPFQNLDCNVNCCQKLLLSKNYLEMELAPP